MNWLQIAMQILNLLLFVVGLPIASSICAYLYRKRLQRLPENQRLALEQFAQLAVQAVEQQNKNLKGGAKKPLAIAAMMELYREHPQLRAPSSKAMEIAIDAACLWLPKRANG